MAGKLERVGQWWRRGASGRASFLRGMASVLDISGSLRRESVLPERYRRSGADAGGFGADSRACAADAEAIASDWRAVGDDMRQAMAGVEDDMTPEEREALHRRLRSHLAGQHTGDDITKSRGEERGDKRR